MDEKKMLETYIPASFPYSYGFIAVRTVIYL